MDYSSDPSSLIYSLSCGQTLSVIPTRTRGELDPGPSSSLSPCLRDQHNRVPSSARPASTSHRGPTPTRPWPGPQARWLLGTEGIAGRPLPSPPPFSIQPPPGWQKNAPRGSPWGWGGCKRVGDRHMRRGKQNTTKTMLTKKNTVPPPEVGVKSFHSFLFKFPLTYVR